MSLGDKLKGALKGVSNLSKSYEARNSGHFEGDEYETRDKSLKALRRQRRSQMDIDEKKRLRDEINAFERRKTSEDIMGTPTLTMPQNAGKGVPRAFKGKSKGFSFLGKGGS